MSESVLYVSKEEFEGWNCKSDVLGRTIDVIKDSLDKLETIVEMLEEEYLKLRYKSVEFENRIERLERHIKDKKKIENGCLNV